MEPESTAPSALTDRAHTSGLVAALTALFVVPAWGGFDVLLEPRHAFVFIVLRACCEVPLGVLFWLLWRHPLGRRHPELLTLLVLVVVQSEIAWMLVRASEARDFYLLGFSLPLYGSGCLMGGRPRWTGAAVAATFGLFGIALLTAPTSLSQGDLGAGVFYLGTAAVIGWVGHVERYRLAMREAAARHQLETEQAHTKKLLDQVSRLSHEDPLTGLANRRNWDVSLTVACAEAAVTGAQLAVLLVDVDHFKTINDTYGHGTGDTALREVAVILTRQVKGRDLVARVGGDEFAVLLMDTDLAGATTVAHHIQAAASQQPFSGHEFVSLSIGVAGAQTEIDPAAMMQDADRALYRAKRTRNSVAVSGPLHAV